MSQLLQIFILLPLLGCVATVLIPAKRERSISMLSVSLVSCFLAAITAFILYWVINGAPNLDIKHITFFEAGNIEIFIDLYFDKTTAVFTFVGGLITLLVIVFSRFYLHRDHGFKRFFTTTLLFFFAYNLVIFSGNFETMFIGWEILGICSFLLIAFYRDRYLPVKNGLKVISVYRLGDICLILVMWMSHHLWHKNITFAQFNDSILISEHIQQYGGYAIFLAMAIVIAAAVKSAQLPFFSWLPRAMEGPTSSSAIFYGSLSVHLGVFLLIRTYPYWESIAIIKWIIIGIGITTSVIGFLIASVQATVKTQIAYASITQIGLMFVEVALGFHTLALIHFAGNALLRTYQLLVSPSVLSYLIHDMVFSYKPPKATRSESTLGKLRNSLYMLGVKEWNSDTFLFRYAWNPFKILGRVLTVFKPVLIALMLTILFLAGMYSLVFAGDAFNEINNYLPILFSIICLLLVLRSFSERQNATRAWILVIGAQLFITLSIALSDENFNSRYILIYLSGIAVCALIGYWALRRIRLTEGTSDLNRFYGHSYEYPGLSFVFLIACLGFAGLPFTPTFIGMDLLFNHIQKDDYLLIVTTSLSFLFMELAVLRIYARIFLGQHKKEYHPIAYRSS